MLKSILKYFLVFLVISSNIEKFFGTSTSTKVFSFLFVVLFIFLIFKLFSIPNPKKTTFEKPKSLSYFSSPINPKVNIRERDFKKNINHQLNSLLKEQVEIFWVDDKHRTHPWSLEPGGSTVVVLLKNQKCVGYDKVKRPDSYTKSILSDYITNNYSNVQYHTMEEYINAIFLAENQCVALKKIWDNNMDQSPWEILENYRIK